MSPVSFYWWFIAQNGIDWSERVNRKFRSRGLGVRPVFPTSFDNLPIPALPIHFQQIFRVFKDCRGFSWASIDLTTPLKFSITLLTDFVLNLEIINFDNQIIYCVVSALCCVCCSNCSKNSFSSQINKFWGLLRKKCLHPIYNALSLSVFNEICHQIKLWLQNLIKIPQTINRQKIDC